MRRALGRVKRGWKLLGRDIFSGDKWVRSQSRTYARARSEMLAREGAHRLGLKRLEVRPSGRKPEVIVSMTSIPSRLDMLHLVVKCFMRQTLPPDRIVLWLSERHLREELGTLSPDDIPPSLRELEGRGLEIRWTEDIGGYRKVLTPMQEFPEAVIIHADDDLYYSRRTVEALYRAYEEHGAGNIYCWRSRVIKRVGEGASAYYAAEEVNWTSARNDERLLAHWAVLYPPGVFTEEAFNRDVYMKMVPYGDDCWVTAMAMLNGGRVFQVDAHEIGLFPIMNKHALFQILQQLSGDEPRSQFNRHMTALLKHYGLEF